ncbi:MAG: hypothetical protein IJK52_05870 [Oscillospiraceae bacterium]|nr:hypothetical protein [Oscillospiraceae bacterium]
MRKALNHNVTKAIALILCAVLPLLVILEFLRVHTFSLYLYNALWCGFYGCILACLAFRRPQIKAVAITLNALPFAFLCVGALMGGWHAPFLLALKAAIPFLPLP